MPRAFDDQIRPRNSTAPETADPYNVHASYSQLQPPTTLPLYVPHQQCNNNLWPSNPLPPLHHDGSNIPVTHSSYSLMLAGNESSSYTRALVFSQPFDIPNSSGPSQPLPNLVFRPGYGNPPLTTHHPTMDPTLHSTFPCQQYPWPAGDIQVGSVDGHFPTPSLYHPSIPSQQSSTSPHTPKECISEPDCGTSGASCPCQWVENGIICNVMVQATRSHINRHLHTDHEFGGSDTHQTRCRWAGCGEAMQQGSIARHVITCHLQAKVTCPMCFKKLSRQDVISKHQRVCPAAGAWR